MFLSETGEYVYVAVDERGRIPFAPILEDGRLIFEFGAAPRISTSDLVALSDGIVISRPRGTQAALDRIELSDGILKRLFLRFDDAAAISDIVNASRISPPRQVSPTETIDLFDTSRRLLTKQIADRAEVSDAVFLHQLLQTISVTDRQTVIDQALIQLITREMRFFDAFPIHDDLFVTTFAQSLEHAMAGIRTLTCTPGYEIKREAITQTSVVDFDQAGLFALFGRSSRPAYKFRVPIIALTKVQVDSLNAFHMFHQGARPFFWDGGRYGYIQNPNLIGEGDSSRKDFFLPNRNIDPNSITVAVYDGATTSITTAFSLNPVVGAISFTTAPQSGHDVMAAHAHKYKCVFEPDGLITEEIHAGIFKAELVLREIL